MREKEKEIERGTKEVQSGSINIVKKCFCGEKETRREARKNESEILFCEKRAEKEKDAAKHAPHKNTNTHKHTHQHTQHTRDTHKYAYIHLLFSVLQFV